MAGKWPKGSRNTGRCLPLAPFLFFLRHTADSIPGHEQAASCSPHAMPQFAEFYIDFHTDRLSVFLSFDLALVRLNRLHGITDVLKMNLHHGFNRCVGLVIKPTHVINQTILCKMMQQIVCWQLL